MKSFAVRRCGLLLILATLAQIIIIERYACSAEVRLGNRYVDIRELKGRDAKKIGKPLNHPYELSDDVVDKILSSIYYKEKGLFRSKKTRLAVFTTDEVRTLAPLVADAFSNATVSDYVIVYSTVQRMLLSDLHTYCMLFITSLETREGVVNELNVAFTAIRQRLSYNITESEKARIEKLFAKPVDIKKSSFWELVPIEGQRLKEGHRNWLLIDLNAIPTFLTSPYRDVRGGAFAEDKAKRQVPPGTAYASELEERVKRLEEKASSEPAEEFRGRNEEIEEDTYIRADVGRDYMPQRPSGLTEEERKIEESRNLDIKEKLIRLRALRDEGLITEDDYRSKKAQLIRQEQKGKSIREKLKELRDMRDEGLITGKDYESLKKKLLDKWF